MDRSLRERKKNAVDWAELKNARDGKISQLDLLNVNNINNLPSNLNM